MPTRDTEEDRYDPALATRGRHRFVVLSGCSGGGKSTLLAALSRRGHAVYPEPGRQVVKEQRLIGGDALPWADMGGFVALTVSRSVHFLVTAAASDGRAFFDRGIVDQAAALEHLGLPVPASLRAALERLRYHDTVFMVPPWQDVFRTDAERHHGFESAVAAYETLCRVYRRLGYRPVVVPQATPAERAAFVLEHLGMADGA